MFFLSACDEIITEFEVPTTANTGDIIRINLSVNTTSDGQNDTVNYAVLMPSNWSVVLVNQTFPINQILTEDISFAVNVNDVDPAPEGYVWRGFVGEGYGPYSENDTHQGFALLNVTSPGTFTLKSAVGYRSSGVENISGGETIVVSGVDISLPYSFSLNSCKLLEQPGVYTMTSSFDATSNGCFSLMKNDTTIDCQGHTLSGNLDYNSPIYYSGNRLENITIRNCAFDRFRSIDNTKGVISIEFTGSIISSYSFPSLENLLITNSIGTGIYFSGSSFSMNDITINNLSSYGIYIQQPMYLNISDIAISNSRNGIYVGNNPINNIFNNISFFNSSQLDISVGSSTFLSNPVFSQFTNVSSNGVPISFYRFTGGSQVIENQEFSQLIIQDSGPIDLTLRNISLVNSAQRNEVTFVDVDSFSSFLIEDSNISNSFGGLNFLPALPLCNLIVRNSYFSNNFNGIGITGATDDCLSYSENTIQIYNNTFLYDNGYFTKGVRIINGGVHFNTSTIGNIWLTEDNQGFSQVCDDVDNNSICDNSFLVSPTVPHYDYLAQTSDVLFPQPIISSSSGGSVSSLFPLSSLSSLFVIIFLLFAFIFY
ncbi:MAG: hypothetical protein VXZ40_04475 [Nanoarchaeota archaeon]|nr:hypothetical protein [Nanoarchaeota archaeon]